VVTICKYYRGIVFKSDPGAGFIDFKTMPVGSEPVAHFLLIDYSIFSLSLFSPVLTLTEYNPRRKGRETREDKISFHERHLN